MGKVVYVTLLRDLLIDKLLKIPYFRLNGDRQKRLCNNVNIFFEAVEGESLLFSVVRR